MKDQVVYKVRHKATGLFYQPVKGRFGYQKSNLGKRGRIYETKQYPKPKDLARTHINISESLVKKFLLVPVYGFRGREAYLPSSEEDWEIVEYKLIEIEPT